MEQLLDTHASITYLVLFGITFISSMGLPIGSEVAVAYGGVLASGQSDYQIAHPGALHLNLAAVIVAATLGEICGSFAGYAIGYFGGRPLVDRFGKYVLLTHADLDRAEAWFNGRGEWSVLVVRFIPLARSFISLVAGLAEMSWRKFLVLTTVGCLLWCSMLAGIGYSLGATYEHVLKKFSDVGYVVAALVVLAVILAIVHRVRVRRREAAGEGPRHARRGPDAPA